MSDLVDRVAKASYEAWAEMWISVSGKPAVNWDQLREDIRESYRDDARASISRITVAYVIGTAFDDAAIRNLGEE